MNNTRRYPLSNYSFFDTVAKTFNAPSGTIYASVKQLLTNGSTKMNHLLCVILGLCIVLPNKASYAAPLVAPGTPTIELLEEAPLSSVVTEEPDATTTVEPPIPEPDSPETTARTERENYWADLGYSLQFDYSVSTTDFGRSGEDFLTDMNGWANGNPTHTNWIDESLISFTEAPDGTPAMRSRLNIGDQQSLNWRGQQLGQDNKNNDAVFSIEVWADSPRTLQSYIGAGHYWGSRPGVTHAPGGSVNFNDAWTVRAVLHPAGTIRGYIYEARSPSSTQYGTVIHGTEVLPTDQWVRIESEVISNKPASSANGIVRTIVNGVVSNETTGIKLRQHDDVYPKGQGMLIRNNASAATVETIYIRNWQIYTKP